MRRREHFVKKEEVVRKDMYDNQNEPMVISKATSDILLNNDPDEGEVYKRPGDLMALYWFYYYTAKWQETNSVKATTSYTAKGLRWSEERVRRAKKELKKTGLIEDSTIRDKKTKKIIGHYVYVKFIWWKKENLFPQSHPPEKREHGILQGLGNPDTNALSTITLNALNTLNKNINIDFLKEWNEKKIITHKKITSKKKAAITKALKDYNQEEIFKAFHNYSEVLKNPEYFWSYKWTLEDFLQRGLHKFVDEAQPLIVFRKESDLLTKNKLPSKEEKLSPRGFPLISKPYSRARVFRTQPYGFIEIVTLEEWQNIFEEYVFEIIKKDIWLPNYNPCKIKLFKKFVSIQEWLEKVDYSIDGGGALKEKINPLDNLLSQYLLCIDNWWRGWIDGIKVDAFDVDSKLFKMFIREIETSFALRINICSEGWVNTSDWEPRD